MNLIAIELILPKGQINVEEKKNVCKDKKVICELGSQLGLKGSRSFFHSR